jgi:thioredoxin-related protein
MKAVTSLALFAVVSVTAMAKPLDGWSTDLTAAMKQAKDSGRQVLVEFTGSDWCPPCIAMRKNVFSKKEFVDAASKKFVLVELDLPKGDKEVKERNRPLAEKYRIDGFPTVLLLTPDDREFGRFYASEYPTVEKMLAQLEKLLAAKSAP